MKIIRFLALGLVLIGGTLACSPSVKEGSVGGGKGKKDVNKVPAGVDKDRKLDSQQPLSDKKGINNLTGQLPSTLFEKNRTFKGNYNQSYFDFAFLPDGKQLVTTATFGMLLWDIETGNVIRIMEDSQDCSVLALSPDGKWALAFKGFIGLWDISSGKRIGELRHIQYPVLH